MDEDTRPIDDPARLAEEAQRQIADNAASLRRIPLGAEVEPPTAYRP